MSAHTRKHPINSGEVLNLVYKGWLYQLPKKVVAQYKTEKVDADSKRQLSDLMLADDVFTEFDAAYTKAGALLQGLRHRENLNQVEFARRIEVSQADLSKMENGKRPIGKIVAKRIAKAFGVHYRLFLE